MRSANVGTTWTALRCQASVEGRWSRIERVERQDRGFRRMGVDFGAGLRCGGFYELGHQVDRSDDRGMFSSHRFRPFAVKFVGVVGDLWGVS